MSGTEILKWSEIEETIRGATVFKSMNVPDEIVNIIVEDTFVWHWDESMTFGMDINEDPYKCMASHTLGSVKAPSGWQTTRGNLCLDNNNGYIYEWDIKVIDYHPDYGDVIIGILCDDGVRPNKPNDEYEGGFIDKCKSWSYASSNTYNTMKYSVYNQYSSRDFAGSTYRWKDKELDQTYRAGDVITVIYDSKLGTLRFKKNGQDVKLVDDQSKSSNIIFRY